jgi:hypothetical protein
MVRKSFPDDLNEVSVTVEPTMDRTALWMTLHGAMEVPSRTQFLSLPEAKLLARTLQHQIRRLERRVS